MLETPNYQIALVTNVMSVFFIEYVVSVITALLIITIGYSEGRLLVLSKEVRLLRQDALHHYKENFNLDYREGDKYAATELNRYIRHRLQSIVKSHATNVVLVNRVGDIFSGAIAVEFILLTLSLIGDLLGGLENTYIVTPLPVMQVMMDCFTGQKLMDASIAFENAVYDCKWENFDASNMKMVQKGRMWAALRKIGLDHSDLPTMVRSVAAMLRVVAVRIDRNDKSLSVFSYIMTVTCTMCYIYNYQVSMLWFVFVRCRETGDMLAAAMIFSVGTASLIGITKLLYMYAYRDKVQFMVAAYIEFDKMPVAPASQALLASSQRAVKKRALVFGAVIIGNGVVYILLPQFKPGRHLMDDEQVLYGLEPMLETPNYQIALVTNVMSVFFIEYVVSVITALLIITIGYSEGRLLVLSKEVRLLRQDALHHYKENFNLDYREGDKYAATELNRYIRHRLQSIVKSHATNVVLVNRVGDIFSGAIAVEFILLTLSLIGDLLGGLENTYIVTPLPVMQVMMDCFTGQKLMDASIAFENAVYDCKWENFDASNMKMVQVMLQISQKTLNVSAGGLVTLSFSTLMSLVRSVYSAYTALRSSVH